MHPRPNMPVVTPITWGARGTYLTFATFRFVENIHFCANTLATDLTAVHYQDYRLHVGCDGRWVRRSLGLGPVPGPASPGRRHHHRRREPPCVRLHDLRTLARDHPPSKSDKGRRSLGGPPTADTESHHASTSTISEPSHAPRVRRGQTFPPRYPSPAQPRNHHPCINISSAGAEVRQGQNCHFSVKCGASCMY